MPTSGQQTIEFEVVGSQGDIYRIVIYPDEPAILCTCPAGSDGGRHCKHRIEILEGNFERLLEPKSVDQAQVRSIFEGSKILQGLARFREAEDAHADAKRKRDQAARDLASLMFGHNG